MTFSSPYFYLLFLPFVLVGFEILGRFGRRSAISFLALMSLIFYARWSRVYVLFLLSSIVVNYLFSFAIDRSVDRPRYQSLLLKAGILVNLTALCYYKYLFPFLNFLTDAGLTTHGWTTVILPLGISFFTFTQIAYLIDLKQGVAKLQDPVSYLLFVTFFPHLIAGPIIHHKEMMPQFNKKGRYCLSSNDFSVGLTWFVMGMFKKAIIADHVAPTADSFFSHPQGITAAAAWLGVLSYSMQLYFDFSGYSDMAVGLARMFSIRFPLNFNSPYKAANIIDFWQRWHMTLTRYIMSYLYGPVQLWINKQRLTKGKKVSRKAMATAEGFTGMVALPTLFTMFWAGVWHGAGLQFLVFGLLHGLYLVANHAWRIFIPSESRLRKVISIPIGVLLTYLCVLIAQVFFRANSFNDAVTVLADMFAGNGVGRSWPAYQIFLMITLFAVVWLLPNTQEILGETKRDDEPNWNIFPELRWTPTFKWWLVATATFLISMFYSSATSTFLYFQF